MLVTKHDNPQFVAVESFTINTNKGLVVIGAGEPIALSIMNDNIVVGNGGTVLEVSHKTALDDLWLRLREADFSLRVEEDGEISLVSSLNEARLDIISLIDSLPICSKTVDVAQILNIRSM